jgi:hypothetical protein
MKPLQTKKLMMLMKTKNMMNLIKIVAETLEMMEITVSQKIESSLLN